MSTQKKIAPEKTSGAPFKQAAPVKRSQDDQLAAASIALALTFLGVKEATGHNDGSQVKIFQDYVGKWVEGQPWCAAFASFCIGTSAKKLGLKTVFATSASSTQIYSDAQRDGTLLAQPIPYCIGLIKGNGGSPGKTHEHTFRVISVDAVNGVVHTVDGNWANSVCKTVHPIHNCDFVAVV